MQVHAGGRMSDDAFLHEARKADQAQIADLAAAVERLQVEVVRLFGERDHALAEVERLRSQRDGADHETERAKERIVVLDAEVERLRTEAVALIDRLGPAADPNAWHAFMEKHDPNYAQSERGRAWLGA